MRRRLFTADVFTDRIFGSLLPPGPRCARTASPRRAGVAMAMLALAPVVATGETPAEAERTASVTATAYNSLPGQTHGDPRETAWGDRLEPGMKAIAVSRDLIELGLVHGVEVGILGLPGVYTVRDKMAKRWRRRIDIYMGQDVEAARRWGRREVEIRWRAP